jgi:hypothetical protein
MLTDENPHVDVIPFPPPLTSTSSIPPRVNVPHTALSSPNQIPYGKETKIIIK